MNTIIISKPIPDKSRKTGIPNQEWENCNPIGLIIFSSEAL